MPTSVAPPLPPAGAGAAGLEALCEPGCTPPPPDATVAVGPVAAPVPDPDVAPDDVPPATVLPPVGLPAWTCPGPAEAAAPTCSAASAASPRTDLLSRAPHAALSTSAATSTQIVGRRTITLNTPVSPGAGVCHET